MLLFHAYFRPSDYGMNLRMNCFEGPICRQRMMFPWACHFQEFTGRRIYSSILIRERVPHILHAIIGSTKVSKWCRQV